MRNDIRNYNVRLAESTIENNGNMKVLRAKLKNAKKLIFKLKDKQGVIQTDRNKILDIAKGFYEDLFRSKRPKSHAERSQPRPVIMNVGSEEMPEITEEEVKAALKEMKNKKAPGDDDIPIEAIKEGGET